MNPFTHAHSFQALVFTNATLLYVRNF